MIRHGLGATALAVLSSCFSPSYPGAGLACPDGVCPPGQACTAGVCVADDGVDATPGPDAPVGPDASTCVPVCLNQGQVQSCPDGTLLLCAHGCADSPIAHCRTLDVSNDPEAADHLVGVTGSLIVPEPEIWLIATDTGEILDGMGSVVRASGVGVSAGGIGYYQTPTIGILAVQTLTVGDRARLRAYGARALLILSAGDVNVAGVIDVSGSVRCVSPGAPPLTCAGPGGGAGGLAVNPGDGCGPGQPGVEAMVGGETGGGGGGFASQGGNGGATDLAGGVGGSMCGDPTLIPLRGGSGGGGGASDAVKTTVGGVGGGGGGALQISAYTQIRFHRMSAGTQMGIFAGGQGGGGGQAGSGGGGGGAGGAILLEAPQVNLDGCGNCWYAANGGGGGAGGTTSIGGDGQAGGFNNNQSGGGGGGNPGGEGAGGAQGAQNGADVVDGSGGGGGGGGTIRVNSDTPSGGGVSNTSPAATTGTTVYR